MWLANMEVFRIFVREIQEHTICLFIFMNIVVEQRGWRAKLSSTCSVRCVT